MDTTLRVAKAEGRVLPAQIACRKKLVLEGIVGPLDGHGMNRVSAVEVETKEHLGLKAFHVERQVVDRRGRPRMPQDVRQRDRAELRRARDAPAEGRHAPLRGAGARARARF